MFGYYLSLARRSLKRNKALTLLMILAIAFGVGASMTTLTVLHVLSADPIPGKSHKLYAVELDPRKMLGYLPGREPDEQVTRRDGEALLRAARADRQVLMTAGSWAIEPDRTDLKPFYADARMTSPDFFAMFDVPFIAGTGWTADDEQKHARVIVITRGLAEKLFGTTEVVGRTIRVEGTPMRVLGVIADWNPEPHFFDLHVSNFGQRELLYGPYSTAQELKLGHNGSTDCWGESEDQYGVGAPCVWLQYWVELDSKEKAAAYREYLLHYSEDELRAGRFERPPNVRIRDVIDFLTYQEVIPNDARLQNWVALGFLLVCLINTVGLLLTKFMRRASEIGVRRALGASRRAIFVQLLVEAGVVGVIGGLLGIGLAYLGLWAVHHQPTQYAHLAQLDVPMLIATFGLAVVASLLAGLLPAWRGCQITPAIQLKSH